LNQPIEILKQYWGYDCFRPLQEEIIQSVLNNKDTLAMLPTGGGKSICYQVPALILPGICLVISPLIALMKDQVDNLKSRGIKAIAVYSGMTNNEIDIALDNCIYGDIKIVYMSPERLGSDLARKRIEKMKVSLIAVDEAHCISQWGYDFRPSYLKIAQIKELHPSVPIIALTATATVPVIEDIQKRLLFKFNNVFSTSFNRPNLTYACLEEEDKNNRIIRMLNRVQGSAIIYVRNRKKTIEIANHLNKNNISADYYHAGLPPPLRDLKQMQWMKSHKRVMVATNAFGMGIDKPDVRMVIHFDLPDSPEAYFQEAGRAGRDGLKAFAILLFNHSDILEARKNYDNAYPPVSLIKQVYNALGNYYQLAIGSGKGLSFPFDIHDFANSYNLNITTVYNSLKLLEKEELITLSDSILNPSRVFFTVNNEELYKYYVANPKFEALIKTILRSYSGIFNNYTKISELELASRLNTNTEIINKNLEYLKSLNILDYVPANDKPQISYLKERIPENDLLTSTHIYNFIKEQAGIRIEKMIDYVSQTSICRNVFLLGYFSEPNTSICKKCDICRSGNNNKISDSEFEIIKKTILSAIKNNNNSLPEIVNMVQGNEQKTITVLRFLIDNGEIKQDEDGESFIIC